MLRKMRRERDITQRELAIAVGVERSTVAKWERGKAVPRLPMLMKLAAFFNCAVEDLMPKQEPK